MKLKYGNWTVLCKGEKKRYWVCRCVCGVEKEVHESNLKDKKSKGCKYSEG